MDRVLSLFPRLVFYLLFTLALAGMGPATAAENKGSYSFYVIPQLPPVVMQQAWGPLLKRLSQETGYHFALDIPPSIPAFEALLFKGIPDFIFTNPYLIVASHKHQNYIPLVRSNAMLLQGYLVVRKDSPLKSLQDLKGKTMAFPAPNSFAASLYMRSLMDKAGVTVQPRYVGAHSNVYRQVVYGEVAAGGGVNYSFDREPQEIRDQLRVLFKTPPASPHPVAAHNRIPPAVREAVAAALLRIAASPDGAELMNAAQLPKPVRADYQRDYQPMEQLGLDRFFVYGED
jgi:phosphonate transport system substrate-binding protein